ncbi:MAG: PAS domain-containing protein [Pyrinomonadaceae bacterium]|nr:PAS domain-containing protein [Pyrinomonadaceae bacterium]
MLTSSPPKKQAGPISPIAEHDGRTNDLRFISELGRSLLFTVHPKRVASRVADAIYNGVDAKVCVFVAELASIGLITCAFGPDGVIGEGSLDRTAFDKWLAFMPPQIGYSEESADEFLIKDVDHGHEYISPLHINGKIKGAIITGFTDRADFTDHKARLIDAATQMAAMSVNLSAHYEGALNDSINEAREEHRKFTEAILDALPVSLYVVDRDYRIVTWNRHREVGKQGIPRDIAIGRDVFDVLEKYPQGRLREEFERAFRTGRIERIEQQTVADDGSTLHWMVSKIPMKNADGDVTHVITVGEDVTVRVEAIHAINRAEKLAAVGRLAAGVVHEINNPLATIAACAESLEQRIDEGFFNASEAVDDLTEYLGLIKSEAFRCKTITTGLLDFSRIRTGERSHIDAGEIVRSAANLISHQKRGNDIVHELEIDDDLPLVSADGGQIQQAVIALATNAIDAMVDGGRLTFRVYQRGNRVVIEVADNGAGIPQENMSKIFEPFFTTKEVGRGTGLGLAVCYGIISEHGGRLSVRSTLGKGTTFSIFLPATF